MKAVLLALLVTLPAAGNEDSFLLRGATIHTVSGPDITNGAVLVRDGKIAKVGVKTAGRKGLRVIDVKGLHVFPAMIDSATEIGLLEITAVRETSDASELGDFNPQLRAEIAVNPSSEHIPVTRVNGIGSVITMPLGGIICGQAALINLDGWTWEEMEVRRSAAMHMRFPAVQLTPSGRPFRNAPPIPYPEAKRTYDKQIRELQEFFDAARRYQKAKLAKASGLKPDLKFEAMLPILERSQPLLITAVREREIREALKFAEKENLRMVLAQPGQPEKFLAELKSKNIPVVLGPTLRLPLEEDDPYDQPFALPAELYKAGVKFAFGSFSNEFSRNLPYQAATAVAYGLPYAEALKAVTLNAAEIWGVGDELGSIDNGKWANLMVTDGDPLETKTQVKQLFIRGKAVNLDSKHHRLYEKYMNRP